MSNKYSCMGDAFSLAIGIQFADFVKYVGHDGSNGQHLGFHPQECIDIALKYGYSCTPIQLYVGMIYDFESQPIIIWPKDFSWNRFCEYVQKTKKGVIEGIRIKNGKQIGHAVTLIHGMIYDSRGENYSFDECLKRNFYPQTLWILNPIGVVI